jgi:hypothetical protein
MTTNTTEEDVDLVAPDGATKVEARVKCRLSGRLRDFRLLIRGEGLILRGRTRTYYAKQLAQQAVMEVTAMPILANEIEVS